MTQVVLLDTASKVFVLAQRLVSRSLRRGQRVCGAVLLLLLFLIYSMLITECCAVAVVSEEGVGRRELSVGSRIGCARLA